MEELRSLRTSKELQRATALFHEQLGHLPAARTGDMRVFQHVMGSAAQASCPSSGADSRSINLHTGGQPSASDVEVVAEMWNGLGHFSSLKGMLG